MAEPSQDSRTPSKEELSIELPTIEAPPRPREGDFAGWATVFGAFWGLFGTFGQLITFGSYQAYYIQHQLAHRPPSSISLIGSLQLWSLFFSGIFIGRLFDAYGPKRLILVGTTFITVGIITTSFSTRYWQLVVCQGLLLGIGTGFVFYPTVSSTQTHFVRLRSTATSIAMTGPTVGGIVFPFILEHLFARLGYAWAVRISGIVSVAGCLVALACCTSRLPPRQPKPLADLVTSLKDLKYMSFSVGCGIMCFGYFIPFYYVAQYGEQVLQASSTRVFALNSAVNAGSVVARPLLGVLADLIGRYNVIGPTTFISGVLCLAIWFTSTSYTSLMSYTVLYGFWSSTVLSLTAPCVAQISRPELVGTRVGLTYAVMSFPSLAAGPIAGALLQQQHGSYHGMIIFSGVSLMLGSFVTMMVRLSIDPRVTAKV